MLILERLLKPRLITGKGRIVVLQPAHLLDAKAFLKEAMANIEKESRKYMALRHKN